MTIQCICSFCNKSSLLCGKEKSQGLAFLWTFPVWLELYCAWDIGTPQIYPAVHWWFLFGVPAWVNIQSLLFLQGVQHFLPAAHWSLCKSFLGIHFKVLLSSLLREQVTFFFSQQLLPQFSQIFRPIQVSQNLSFQISAIFPSLPKSTAVCSHSKLMATFFHLYTQQEAPQSREAERMWFFPASTREDCSIKIFTDQGNFLSLVPANIPVLRISQKAPHNSDCLEGSVRLGSVMHKSLPCLMSPC